MPLEAVNKVLDCNEYESLRSGRQAQPHKIGLRLEQAFCAFSGSLASEQVLRIKLNYWDIWAEIALRDAWTQILLDAYQNTYKAWEGMEQALSSADSKG